MRLKFKIYLALGLVFLFSAGLSYADENQPALPDSQTKETEQQVDKTLILQINKTRAMLQIATIC